MSDVKKKLLNNIERYNTYNRGGKKAVADLRVRYTEKFYHYTEVKPIENMIVISFLTAFCREYNGEDGDFEFSRFKEIILRTNTKKEALEIIEFINAIKHKYLKTNL